MPHNRPFPRKTPLRQFQVFQDAIQSEIFFPAQRQVQVRVEAINAFKSVLAPAWTTQQGGGARLPMLA